MPFITIIVPDTKVIPQPVYYIYHQDQEALLMQLYGDCAALINNLFLTNQCNELLDVGIQELCQSENIVKDVKYTTSPMDSTSYIPSMSLRTSLDYPVTASGTRSTLCTAHFSMWLA